VAGCCKHGNEPSGTIKCWEILYQLSNWWVLKNDSASWSWLAGLLVGLD
jgi:hypothetical protein